MRNAVLLELEVEVGVRETALGPMFLDDDGARLRREIRVPLATPFAPGKLDPRATSLA
jgi:hypothetical protein